MPPSLVVGLIAGGDRALRNPVEFAEDDEERGWEELRERSVSSLDTVIGIAASGTTPYVVGALRRAREHGVLTGLASRATPARLWLPRPIFRSRWSSDPSS